MKIRTGFVANSSSSSFCLLGVSLDPSSFAGWLKEAKADWEKAHALELKAYAKRIAAAGHGDGCECPKCGPKPAFDEGDCDVEETARGGSEIDGLHVRFDSGDDSCAIGVDPSKIPDNETLGAFKARVAAALNKLEPKVPITVKDIGFFFGGGYYG